MLWDELELALREDAAPVPAPVPAPVAPTVPAPIPVALMGWEPHIVAELDATGFQEVPADFHAPVVGLKTGGSRVGGPDLCF